MRLLKEGNFFCIAVPMLTNCYESKIKSFTFCGRIELVDYFIKVLVDNFGIHYDQLKVKHFSHSPIFIHVHQKALKLSPSVSPIFPLFLYKRVKSSLERLSFRFKLPSFKKCGWQLLTFHDWI